MSDEKGFLTDTDRAFLTGEKEYTGENAKQLRYQRRQAIAERTRQAFHDFGLLYDVLDEHERDRIFDIGDESVDEFHRSLVDTFAFLYRSLQGDMGSKPTPFPDRSYRTPFGEVLKEGVTQAEADRNYGGDFFFSVQVDFDVTRSEGYNDGAERRALEKIARREHSKLTKEEMHTLLLQYDSSLSDLLSFLPNKEEKDGYADLDRRVEQLRDELDIPQQAVGEEKFESVQDELKDMIEDAIDEQDGE
jgi:hypothetical protein